MAWLPKSDMIPGEYLVQQSASGAGVADASDPPQTKIDITDPSIDATGMDFIIHNMYVDGHWTTFRKWFQDDADAMLKRVASHVEQGLYSVISLQLSKHSCTVFCVSHTKVEEWPERTLVG